MTEVQRFAFGKNWRSFVKHSFDESRLAVAQRHLLEFLKRDSLAGLQFLDIGCGSGLHSFAAFRAGADAIVSFDYDAESVAATEQLRRLAGSPAHWRVTQGSVLDPAFMSRLGSFDIVYAWGVLHHTGDQWAALPQAAARMAPGGMLYVALYTSDVFAPPQDATFWLGIKQRYNSGNWITRRYLELWYAGLTLHGVARSRQNPIRFVLKYKRSRGMSFFTDVRDWVGGWPMEFSSVAEVKRFGATELGLELANIATGEANTEYLFRRRAGLEGTTLARRSTEALSPQ